MGYGSNFGNNVRASVENSLYCGFCVKLDPVVQPVFGWLCNAVFITKFRKWTLKWIFIVECRTTQRVQ